MLDLFADAFGADGESYRGARPGAAYRDRLLSNPSFFAAIAETSGDIVGAIVAYELVKFEQERSEVYIYDLAVGEAHRRQGIATALIGAVQRYASERGASVVFVQADYADPPAVALYDKLGTREEVLHFDLDPEGKLPTAGLG
jgi:aminoglycoside 3-N-acetyltransferase I